ncbi:MULTISPECIES: hypothetical protein [unclassified Oceanispirochaeta]|uniref:hypothetical protein n=1 Tax=unclassified Oceanispirochaeta TaxID=2635722 RepID=UPI000E098B7E|nr:MULTISPECIES: hypothetical protein [unclassified Oceanispirochaeta]MBF9014757.1 hypothetical protein [Oceanispirochaeta sp. M2]NPD71013.1 hypothetical protein [Oceanispirochaeta sp. M1]RDG33846.1 hypothetical protein DV872_02775 [Oceanispirochaeta sp. M1]
MSQKKSMDKNLVKLLNQYCMMPDDHQDKKDIFNELYKKIYSPALIVSCNFIPADNSLMKEALILSDAFESLTNGMIDEAALDKIDSVPEESLLYPWCSFTKAVHSFYAGDHKKSQNLIKKIPEDSAPGAFRFFFEALLDKDSDIVMEAHLEKLKESVLESSRMIEDSLELIQESVEMEDLLLESAGLLIRDIIKEDRKSAQKIILWCFDRLQLSDVLSDKAVTKARYLFGEQDGYRLSALASLSFDPDRSLVYWLHSLLAYLNERDTSKVTVKAFLSILKDISDTVQLEFELSNEYVQLMSSLVSDLSERVLHIYPDFPGSRDLPEDPFAAIAQLCSKKQQPPVQRKVREVKPTAVQLELFAF